MRGSPFVAAALALAGCNAIFGLDSPSGPGDPTGDGGLVDAITSEDAPELDGSILDAPAGADAAPGLDAMPSCPQVRGGDEDADGIPNAVETSPYCTDTSIDPNGDIDDVPTLCDPQPNVTNLLVAFNGFDAAQTEPCDWFYTGVSQPATAAAISTNGGTIDYHGPFASNRAYSVVALFATSTEPPSPDAGDVYYGVYVGGLGSGFRCVIVPGTPSKLMLLRPTSTVIANTETPDRYGPLFVTRNPAGKVFCRTSGSDPIDSGAESATVGSLGITSGSSIDVPFVAVYRDAP